MTQQEWSLLKASSQLYELQLIKGMLEEHGIHAVILNQQDSSYQSFGEIKLMVPSEQLKQAEEIIKLQA
jgi:hypothetical protein